MQGTGLRSEALLEDVFDILTGKGLTLDGIVDGAGDFFGSINVGKRNDLTDVNTFAQAADTELLVLVFGLWAQ